MNDSLKALAALLLLAGPAAAVQQCPNAYSCFHTKMPLYNQGNPNLTFVDRPWFMYSDGYQYNWAPGNNPHGSFGYTQLPGGNAVFEGAVPDCLYQDSSGNQAAIDLGADPAHVLPAGFHGVATSSYTCQTQFYGAMNSPWTLVNQGTNNLTQNMLGWTAQNPDLFCNPLSCDQAKVHHVIDYRLWAPTWQPVSEAQAKAGSPILSGSSSDPYFRSLLPLGSVVSADAGSLGMVWSATCGPNSGAMALMAAINERAASTYVNGWTQTFFADPSPKACDGQRPYPNPYMPGGVLATDHTFTDTVSTDTNRAHHPATFLPETPADLQRVFNYTRLEGGWGGGPGLRALAGDFYKLQPLGRGRFQTLPAATQGHDTSVDGPSAVAHLSKGDVLVFGVNNFTVGIENSTAFSRTITLTNGSGGHIMTINGYYSMTESDGSKRTWVEVYNPWFGNVEWHQLRRFTGETRQVSLVTGRGLRAVKQTVDFSAPGSPGTQTDPSGVAYIAYMTDGEYPATAGQLPPMGDGMGTDGMTAYDAAEDIALTAGQTIDLITNVDWLNVQ